MKKLFKSRIFFFVLGAVMFSTVSVFAYSLLAQDVGYNPKDDDWDVDNVSNALDELRDDIARFDNLEIVSFQGNRGRNRTLTKELSKGRYVVITIDAVSAMPSSRHTTVIKDYDSDTSLTCNSCSIKRKTAKYFDVSATSSSSGYQSNYFYYSLYEIKINSESDTLTYVGPDYPPYNTLPQNIGIFIYH